MSATFRHRAAVAALAVGAILSLAFAAEPAPDEASSSGKCLEGYVYVEALGGTYGPTQPICLLRTNCAGDIRLGPGTVDAGSVKVHYYVSVPDLGHPDPICHI